MIEEVNTLSNTSSDGPQADDSISQVAAILNAHLSSLQWIDGHTNELQTKVSELEDRQSVQRDYGAAEGRVGGRQRGFGLHR